MIKFTRLLLVLSLVIGTQIIISEAADMKGKALYTQVNMHSLKGKAVTWVNYDVDALIPVNTPVEAVMTSGSSVIFKLKDSGVRLKLKNSRHSGLSGQEWADKHFSESKVNLNKFSKSERGAIERGLVKVGMSKDAVIVSRGYPPAHKTPSLASSTWTYWYNRWNKKAIIFDANGNVSDIKD